jgi:hypothetical protein
VEAAGSGSRRRCLPPTTPSGAQALAMLSTLVGALLLSRAVGDAAWRGAARGGAGHRRWHG